MLQVAHNYLQTKPSSNIANMKVDYKQNSYKEKEITTRVVQMVIKESLTHTSHWRKSEGQTRETVHTLKSLIPHIK